MKIEVKETDDKKWGLFIDGYLLGVSKVNCDAMFAKHFLEKKLEELNRSPA